jgi:hypothetical protein
MLVAPVIRLCCTYTRLQVTVARLQVDSVYVGSAGSKVMLYIHKTVQVMLVRLQVGSVYVGSAGSKVMRYTHKTVQVK